MKRLLLSKPVIIGLLSLALLIPLSMIESKIHERQGLKESVQRDIARSASSAQTLSGPYLVVTYQKVLHSQEKDKEGATKTVTKMSDTRTAVFSAHDLKINGKSGVDTRWRGIYSAILYDLHSQVAAEFRVPRAYGLGIPVEDIVPQNAYMVMNLSDLRGLLDSPKVDINGAQHEFEPGSISPLSGNGMHVTLEKLDPSAEHTLKTSFPLELQGMDTLSVLPSGDNTEMALESTWPHPSFGGSFLPRTHTVDASGFKANWLVPRMARNVAGLPGDESKNSEVFSVSYIDPVNVYLLAERSVKYGLLFVILVFTAFFLFEIMKDLRIHPMQYLLVGLALAIFFLLLISLSEHIRFGLAYAISAAACVALIGLYLTGVLRQGKLAALFSAGIAVLYGAIFGVLHSEDNALLMGTFMMFAALSAVMLLTRRMDWYSLTAKAESAEA